MEQKHREFPTDTRRKWKRSKLILLQDLMRILRTERTSNDTIKRFFYGYRRNDNYLTHWEETVYLVGIRRTNAKYQMT